MTVAVPFRSRSAEKFAMLKGAAGVESRERMMVFAESLLEARLPPSCMFSANSLPLHPQNRLLTLLQSLYAHPVLYISGSTLM